MILNKSFATVFLVFLMSYLGTTQEGIQLNTGEAMPGYILLEHFDNFQGGVENSLLNNCGEVVHKWETGSTDLHAKLLPDGSLIYIQNNAIYRRDWNDNVIATLSPNDPTLRLVYEVILLANGNYLCAARRILTSDEFTDLGWNFNLGSPSVTDGVVEIDGLTGEVVWEWNIKDHVIQERSTTIGNYGIVADNPQLLDCDAVYTYDWTSYESFMINGMDYNPTLDQIALSVRKVGEVMIIDHSTTTAEAKGSTGGNSGMGGDFIYRFGNPQNYGRGTADDRYLFFQHNPNWILHGPHKGKIMCYNNGLDRPDVFDLVDRWSAAPIFDPEENGFNYVLPQTAPYAPLVPEKTYDKFSTGTIFYSGYTSAAKVLPNENILISEGRSARVIEINPNGQIVWEYDLPDNSVYLFRSEKYPLDYPAFNNKDLSSDGSTIENPSSNYNCNLVSSEEINVSELEISWVQHDGYLRVDHALGKDFDYTLISVSGKVIYNGHSSFGQTEIRTSELVTGIYALKILEKETRKFQTIKLFIP